MNKEGYEVGPSKNYKNIIWRPKSIIEVLLLYSAYQTWYKGPKLLGVGETSNLFGPIFITPITQIVNHN